MKIIFQDKEIFIEPKKVKTSVKELIKNLRSQIESQPNEELTLLGKKPDDENYVTLEDHAEIDLDSGISSHEYILIAKQSYLEPTEDKQKSESIEKMLMLVTNAKEQINTSKQSTKKRSVYHHDDGQLEYFEQMIRSGVLPNSTRLRSEIANLLNLQNLNSNDTGQGQNPYFGFNFNNLGNPVNSQNNQTSTNTQSTSNTNNSTIQTSTTSNLISINSSNPNTTSLPNLIPSSLPVRRVRPPAIEPNQEHVQFLMDMGFEEARAKRALIASKNNLNHATEMILNGYDLDLPESGLHSGNYSQILFDSVQMPQLEVQNMQVTNDNNANNNSQELIQNDEGGEEEEFENEEQNY